MSKETISIKSNGIRNELKEIRKSIDKLTNALIEINIAQTHTHENNDDCCNGNYDTCKCKNRQS